MGGGPDEPAAVRCGTPRRGTRHRPGTHRVVLLDPDAGGFLRPVRLDVRSPHVRGPVLGYADVGHLRHVRRVGRDLVEPGNRCGTGPPHRLVTDEAGAGGAVAGDAREQGARRIAVLARGTAGDDRHRGADRDATGVPAPTAAPVRRVVVRCDAVRAARGGGGVPGGTERHDRGAQRDPVAGRGRVRTVAAVGPPPRLLRHRSGVPADVSPRGAGRGPVRRHGLHRTSRGVGRVGRTPDGCGRTGLSSGPAMTTTHEPHPETASTDSSWWSEVGWVHLVYLAFLIPQPIYDPESGLWDWVLVVGIVLVFLPLYVFAWVRPDLARWGSVVPMTALGVVTTPLNSGAAVLFVYAAAIAGVRESRRIALRWFIG